MSYTGQKARFDFVRQLDKNMQDQKVNKDINRVDELCKLVLRDNTIKAVQNSVISCVMVIQMKNEKKANRVSEFWKKRCDLCPANLAWNITTKKIKNKNKKTKQKQKNKTKTKKQNKNKKTKQNQKTKQNKTKDKQTNK